MVRINIQSRKEVAGKMKLYVAALDEGDNPLSTGLFVYTDSTFCGNPVKTMLAGGIETPVENRRGGNIRSMFNYMHNAAVEEGVAVALLHPFSFSYYNQFGYEKVADHLILRFPTRMIDFVPRRSRFVRYDDTMFPDLIQVYQQFSKGRNLMLPRLSPKRFQDKNVYLCYDGDTPVAYILCSESKTMYINNFRDTLLTVNEMAYVSPEGLRELLSFLRMYEGEFEEIELRDAGLYWEIELLLRRYAHTKYTRLPDVAARVLNTEAMLRANIYPQKEGEFTLRVVDSMPSVAGVYRVCYGGGDCRVDRLTDSANADISVPVGVFTRLIYGYDPLDASSIRYLDGVEISGDTEELFRAFPKRPCGVFEHY